MLHADDIPIDEVDQLAAAVVDTVSTKRPTWRHWNLWAEACRQTMNWRFASTGDRETVVSQIVDAAEHASVALTPPELATSPAGFRRDDETSVFRPRHATIYTSHAVLVAEGRLLAQADDTTAPTVTDEIVAAVTGHADHGRTLSREQSEVVTAIAASGQRLDVLVGPAGAGKTTTLRVLREVWETQYGRGSVVGLAPSAAAAQVLGEELGSRSENTAKWLHDHARGQAALYRNQLLIVDEATLADTRTLDQLTAAAARAGAKVLLVGDWAQLPSVDAGGAFAMLAEARADVPELSEVHRFTHHWEKSATLALRTGDTAVIDTYISRGRIHGGTTDDMISAAYRAWRADIDIGLDSVLVTQSAQVMHELNTRARAERILTGTTRAGREASLANRARASVGDVVITRRNNRRLQDTRGAWVRNGDRWHVVDVHPDGSLHVRRTHHRAGADVVLPADYVAEDVDLGYAVTAHRAQGITTDTSHTVVVASTTRESLYVAMTRGRQSNACYVALDEADDNHTTTPAGEESATARSVLFGVLHHIGAERSAHQTIAAEQEKWSSIAQLAAEYETIAASAQRDRWTTLMQHCGLVDTHVNQIIESPAFGPLTASLRRAEAHGYNVDDLLPRLVARYPVEDADDIAAVLHHRVKLATGRPAHRSSAPRLIAGLIPQARGPMTGDHRTALDQRRKLIETRARNLAVAAVEDREAWIRYFGRPPATTHEREHWLREVAVVAAYRDRWNITANTPLGVAPSTEAQRFDATRASAARRRAEAVAAAAAMRDHGNSKVAVSPAVTL